MVKKGFPKFPAFKPFTAVAPQLREDRLAERPPGSRLAAQNPGVPIHQLQRTALLSQMRG